MASLLIPLFSFFSLSFIVPALLPYGCIAASPNSIILISSSTDTSATVSDKAAVAASDQYVEPQNQARSEVGVGPLQWSPSLASKASLIAKYQRNNKGCGLADLSSSQYGANQGWANFAASPSQVVASWVEQKKYYNHTTNTCAAGHDDCGTYTQVVWRKTVQVGCAQARCAAASLTLCLYYPHGNVQGQSPY